jgi:hypothetical protein
VQLKIALVVVVGARTFRAGGSAAKARRRKSPMRTHADSYNFPQKGENFQHDINASRANVINVTSICLLFYISFTGECC